MVKTRKQILSVTIRREVDDNPDTSWIGEYHSDEREGSIDREERGDMGRNEYRYFTPALTGEQTGNPESPEQDYQRMESLQRGDWCFVGIWAEAKIQVAGVIQTIRSGGLWGIESDSDESYFDEVADDELSQLREELRALGFSACAITKAFTNPAKDW